MDVDTLLLLYGRRIAAFYTIPFYALSTLTERQLRAAVLYLHLEEN